MVIGYARVSTDDQNLALQLDALASAGCEIVHKDQGVSGTVIERDGLDRALAETGAGDVLVVWKLDRLGRSLGFLIDLIDHPRQLVLAAATLCRDTANEAVAALAGVEDAKATVAALGACARSCGALLEST